MIIFSLIIATNNYYNIQNNNPYQKNLNNTQNYQTNQGNVKTNINSILKVLSELKTSMQENIIQPNQTNQSWVQWTANTLFNPINSKTIDTLNTHFTNIISSIDAIISDQTIQKFTNFASQNINNFNEFYQKMMKLNHGINKIKQRSPEEKDKSKKYIFGCNALENSNNFFVQLNGIERSVKEIQNILQGDKSNYNFNELNNNVDKLCKHVNDHIDKFVESETLKNWTPTS